MILPPDAALVGSYNSALVILSVLVAISASYVAIDLAERVTSTTGFFRTCWLAAGAIAMGIGIWSMHFTGMLAFRFPVPIWYHWPTVLLSFVIATASAGVSLYIVSRTKVNLGRAAAGGVAMGGGIAAMHYLDMAAMRMAATVRFDLWIVMLSITLAIVNSLVGLWLAFYFRADSRMIVWRKISSSIVMGTAIWLMHYTGMSAASFFASSASQDLSNTISITPLGTAAISGVSLLVLGLAVWTSSADRQFHVSVHEMMVESLIEVDDRKRAEEEARQELESSYRWLAEQFPSGILRSTPDGEILAANPALVRMLGYESEAELMAANLAKDLYVDPAEHNKIIESYSTTELMDCKTLWKKKGGERFPVRLRGRVIRDKAGSVRSFEVIVQT